MERETSIVAKLRDEVSTNANRMGDSVKRFSKDAAETDRVLQALGKRQEEIGRQMAKTQTALDGASGELKRAKKSYAELNDEASRKELEQARERVNKFTAGLKDYKQAAGDTQRAMRELHDQERKAENSGGGSSSMGQTSMLGQLAQAGLTKMVGDTMSMAANTFVGSAFGSDAGTMFSSVLSGAASGAAMGSLAGPLGTAIGGAIGGVLGGINGATQIYERQDDAIKTEAQDQYSTLQTKRAAELEEGSTIAGGREQTRMAFDKLLGGSETAGKYLEEVQKLAVDTNYTYDEITGYTKKLLNSFSSDNVLGMLMDLSDASAGLSLNSSDVDVFVDGLNRMKTQGKATSEYLGYFSTRGLDTSEALARALGIDKSEVADKVSKGNVSGDEAVSAILQYIKEEYGGLSESLASSYDAKTDNLGDTMANINTRLGTAYNEGRASGLDKDLEEYGGALGDALGEMNQYIGEGRAFAENLSGQYMREALSALTLGEETTLAGFGPEQQARLEEMNRSYTNLQALYATSNDEGKAGFSAKMEALRSEAEGMAESAFKVSDASLAIQDSERDLVAALRDNTIALGSWRGNYYMSQEQSKGAGGGIIETLLRPWDAGPGRTGFPSDQDGGGLGGSSRSGGFGGGRTGKPNAWGLNRVPYDNYPALLHEGERVLTGREARQQDSGGGGLTLQITGPVMVREEADVKKVAQEIVRQAIRAKLLAAP